MKKATLTFPQRSQAEGFAIAWSRYSKTGHIVGSGMQNVSVTVFDVTDSHKEWIDNYVSKINKFLNQ
jgi:hypothetical protein